MRRYLLVALLSLAGPLQAEDPAAEEAFAKLPLDLQALLRHLPPAVALQTVAYARQNLIATGNAHPAPERLRDTIELVIAPPGYAAVRSVSAGAMSFPPLSPLVPAISFEAR